MKKYIVRLSADAIVSANAIIEAKDADEARKKALLLDENDLDWDVGVLHEPMENCCVLSVVEKQRQ